MKGPHLSREKLTGHFVPADFSFVILNANENCPIVGGQAVAWWASKYNLVGTDGEGSETITSGDIDFWGGLDDLRALAVKLGRKSILPHEYEMTVWVGAIQLEIDGHPTLAEFLHSVPGLDTNDPEHASVWEDYVTAEGSRRTLFLSPISLVIAKLHCLRHFKQEHRQDKRHLIACLQASRMFLSQLLEQGEVRQVLWNIERLVRTGRLKATARLEAEHGFEVLSAVPLEALQTAAGDPTLDETKRATLVSFCEVRWPQVIARKEADGS